MRLTPALAQATAGFAGAALATAGFAGAALAGAGALCQARGVTAGHPPASRWTAVFFPHTDHAFDLVATAWSPPAHAGIHGLERFLAGLACADGRADGEITHRPREREAERHSLPSTAQ